MERERERNYLVDADLIRDGKVVGSACLGVTFEGEESLNELGEAVLIVQYVWKVPQDFDPSSFTVGADGDPTGSDEAVEVIEGDKVKATAVQREV